MRILKLVCAVLLGTTTTLSFASQFNIQLRDYALPGIPSEFRLGGMCRGANDTSFYAFPPETCGYGPADWYPAPIESTDKTVTLRVEGLATNPDAVDYDAYVTFKEAGANPSAVDDILRLQFSQNALTISLISGSSAIEYINNVLVPANSLFISGFVNRLGEEIYFGDSAAASPNSRNVGNLFDFGERTGPLFSPIVVLSVVPTIPEPTPLALLGTVVLGIFTVSRSKRPAR